MITLPQFFDEIIEAAKEAFEHIYSPLDVSDTDGDTFVWNIEEEPGLIAEVQGVIQVIATAKSRPRTQFEPAEHWFENTKVKVELSGGTYNAYEGDGNPYDTPFPETDLNSLKKLIATEIEDEVFNLGYVAL